MTKIIRNLILTLFVFALVFLVHGQKSVDVSQKIMPKSNIDTIVIIKQITDESIAKHYEQILEKTNNQLSLWWNPYGLFVAMLGVLFAGLAIIAAFVIFRQSKEYKDLINTSLEEHRIALINLISEKNDQLKNYEKSLDRSIIEYEKQLKTAGADQIDQISKFIQSLEEQKVFIDSQFKSYKHSGWQQSDISENYQLNQFTNFNAKITLNQLKQAFVIYIRLVTNDNRKFWIGFAGNTDSDPTKYKIEYTTHVFYGSTEVKINENILSLFKKRFPEINSPPVLLDCVRLRGDDMDKAEILFEYRIS